MEKLNKNENDVKDVTAAANNAEGAQKEGVTQAGDEMGRKQRENLSDGDFIDADEMPTAIDYLNEIANRAGIVKTSAAVNAEIKKDFEKFVADFIEYQNADLTPEDLKMMGEPYTRKDAIIVKFVELTKCKNRDNAEEILQHKFEIWRYETFEDQRAAANLTPEDYVFSLYHKKLSKTIKREIKRAIKRAAAKKYVTILKNPTEKDFE